MKIIEKKKIVNIGLRLIIYVYFIDIFRDWKKDYCRGL